MKEEKLIKGMYKRNGIIKPKKTIKECFCNTYAVADAMENDGYNIEWLYGFYYKDYLLFLINGYIYRMVGRDVFNAEMQHLTFKILNKKQIEKLKKEYNEQVDKILFRHLNKTEELYREE